MPRKSRNKSSQQNTLSPKSRRGRPRKKVAPEALIPFKKQEVATVKKFESLAKKPMSAGTNPKHRQMNPTTSERYYSSDEVEFMNALAEFKQASGRLFPTCSEILGVLRSLGYEKANEEETSTL